MRRSFTVFSIVAHTIVIAAAFYAQIFADSSPLPRPHTPVLFDAGSFMPINVEIPKPRPVATRPAETVSVNAAPIAPPEGVTDETGRETESARPTTGSVIGVDSGPPTAIDGAGVAPIEPPPPPAPEVPIRLHSGMKAPNKIVDVAPAYPSIAQTARVQGVVILEAVVDARGRVESVRVLRSIPLLDRAAVEAVQQWRYTPALLNGQAVPVVMTVTVNFMLKE